jgi:ubiquinone/menaquinone biosynthesis C-methylase UbiE
VFQQKKLKTENNIMIHENNSLLEKKLNNYYRKYYFNDLGLEDWQQRIENRLNEHIEFEKLFNYYRDFLFPIKPETSNVLIIGAGTGREISFFSKIFNHVYALEPDHEACDIIKMRLDFEKLTNVEILQSVAENISLEDNTIDFIWSWTVLEHVSNYSTVLNEIYRVLKPKGSCFLSMPNYFQFYEPHYRLYIPMFFPKFAIKIIVKMNRKNTDYLDWGINYITQHKFRRLLQRKSFDIMQIYHPWPKEWLETERIGMKLVYFFYEYFGLVRDQQWIIRKR